MWLAVKAMLDFEPNKTKKNRKITNKSLREKYNWVRINIARNYSERFSGQNSPNADKNIYVLKKSSGDSARGNRSELITLTGLSRSAISSLLLGNKDSQKGWYFPDKNPKGRCGPLLGIESPQADKTIYKFYHISGAIFEGTQIDFKNHTGLSPSPLINGINKSTKEGWALNRVNCGNWVEGAKQRAQNAANSRGSISGTDNPRAIKKEYIFINTKTMEVKRCKRAEMSIFLNVTSAQMHGMINGHYKIQSWCLKEHYSNSKNLGGYVVLKG